MYLGDCLNPPCQVGGSIVVNGATVQLAPDVEVQGVGDNRILRRVGSAAWYSIYAVPPEFLSSGATPGSLYDSWRTRLQAEQAPSAVAPAPPTPAPATVVAGLGSNRLALVAGLGVLGALLLGRKGRR